MARIVALACLLAALLAPAATAADRVTTARKLSDQMSSAGAYSGALAVDLDSGTTIYARRAGTPRMPASVEKLYTSVTALRRLGPAARLRTAVLAETAPDADGIVDGDLYLRGGGDPTFGTLAAARLARAVAAAGIVGITGRVRGDEGMFDERRGVPSSGYALTSDVGPLSALTFNRGRSGRSSPYWQTRPARFAASAFSKQLRLAGVDVPGRAMAGSTPRDAFALTYARSVTVADLLGQMLPPSDNFMAETLIKVLGARFGGAGSTSAGAAVIRAELAEIGIEPAIVDGSGLSRSDRTSPREVVTLLEELDGDASLYDALAIAGRTGTLEDRMRGTAAQDRCRAKTGTLRDVSALAGYCTTRSGAHVAFAFLMNYVTPYGARILQDRMTAALARYAAS
jgi:D-alanyl-D-alanine carboxypeptidase/D-alanyl-D-alanine-endopeptidase (penicillin-binding protein 4)